MDGDFFLTEVRSASGFHTSLNNTFYDNAITYSVNVCAKKRMNSFVLLSTFRIFALKI